MISSLPILFEHEMDGFHSEIMRPLLSISEEIVDLLAECDDFLAQLGDCCLQLRDAFGVACVLL
jgi:hypothetical protein